MDVRNAKGEKVELVVGMWYVGCNIRDDAPMIPAANWHWGSGAIAEYVGDNEFYDEGAEEPTNFRDHYDYIVESHMGKIAA